MGRKRPRDGLVEEAVVAEDNVNNSVATKVTALALIAAGCYGGHLRTLWSSVISIFCDGYDTKRKETTKVSDALLGGTRTSSLFEKEGATETSSRKKN